MLKNFWKALKSGTDIRGVAVEGAGYDVNLTEDTVIAITNGFILWLAEKKQKSPDELVVSVGRDSRISGPAISAVVKETLLNAGVYVVDCGLASTPAMFMTTVELECDGAVEITASHHPYYRNGLKFFTRNGGLEGDDITAILEYAQDGKQPSFSEDGEIAESDYMSTYAANLRELIKKEINSKEDYHHPLKGFKVVVDAGNGVGGFYATDVLEALGAEIKGSQCLEPNGMFPCHAPNPEDEKAMKFICDAVKKYSADLGIIFDTDVDRGGAVDSNGKEINRNRLVALAAAITLSPGAMIVTDSITSSGLKEFIEKDLKAKHLRFKRGYKNVIDEAIRQNENGVRCPLAIETSGHAAMQENYFLDDGAYLVTKILIKAVQLRNEGKSLDSLIANLKEPVESKEIRIKITDKNFRKCGEKVIADLFKYAEEHKEFKVAKDNHEGIRVSFNKKNGDGWFLLRLSVHDPIMPLNIESDSKGGVDKIYAKIKPFLEECEGLETCTKKPQPKQESPKKTVENKTEEVKPVAPIEEEKTVETETAPVTVETETAPVADEKPVETETDPVTDEKPVETETAPVTDKKPVETETNPVTDEKPVETETAPVADEKPVETETDPVTDEKPVETENNPVTDEKPVETETAPVTDEKPVETETTPVTDEKPVETETAPVTDEKPAEIKPTSNRKSKKSNSKKSKNNK